MHRSELVCSAVDISAEHGVRAFLPNQDQQQKQYTTHSRMAKMQDVIAAMPEAVAMPAC